MFTLKKTQVEPTALEKEIDALIKDMSENPRDSESYNIMAANLKALREAQAAVPAKPTLSPDTVASVIGSLSGILMIIGYERMNVITSKAVSFVMKPKV